MTMLNGLCDVCGVEKPIGVASTSIPYSCAYCPKCAAMGADPEAVFEYILKQAGGHADRVRLGLTTFKDGRYIDFHSWAAGWTAQDPKPEPKP